MTPKLFSCSLILSSLFLLSLIFYVSGCSGTSSVTESSDQNEQKVNYEELEALYWARIDSSRMSFTDADVEFMEGMIAHHAQALIMSRLAPENDASPAVQRLAARIINAQDGEIATMQKWLSDRGQAVPRVHIDGLNLMIHMEDDEEEETDHDGGHHHGHGHHGHHDAMAHHHDMPGMLTQEQLEKLASVKGREFDRYFLKFMIEHHEGAVYMVDELFSIDGAGTDTEAFELASDIHAEQVTEIARMRLMLNEITE